MDSSQNEQKDRENTPAQILARPPWLQDQRYQLALRAMSMLREQGYRARLAGGCVRDRLLGVLPKDYDIATDASPPEMCDIFKQKNVKLVPTGLAHGTVTIVMAGQGIEVTSLRRDVSTDGRRATVAFGASFVEDSERRDFTINAMYEDHLGGIYDYHDGYSDLQNARLRFVGDPSSRIREDYLRILRLFRFWARLGFQPDQATLQAVAQEQAGLRQVSQERITSELLALLGEEETVPPLVAMAQTGVLAQVLHGQLEVAWLGTLDQFRVIRARDRSLVRLAALFIGLGATADHSATLARLRLSTAQLHRVQSLLTPPTQGNRDTVVAMQLLDRLSQVWGGDGLTEVLFPAWSLLHPGAQEDVLHLERLEQHKGARRRASIPLRGEDLMRALSLSPGPELGEALEFLKASYRLEQWDTPEEGLALLRSWLEAKT